MLISYAAGLFFASTLAIFLGLIFSHSTNIKIVDNNSELNDGQHGRRLVARNPRGNYVNGVHKKDIPSHDFFRGQTQGPPELSEENRERVKLLDKELAEIYEWAFVPSVPVEDMDHLEKWLLAEYPNGVIMSLSSTDRGTRTTGFGGDKFHFMLLQIAELTLMCEAGFPVRLHLIVNWEIHEEQVMLDHYTYCQRIGGSYPVSYEFYDLPIGGELSYKHRKIFTEVLHEFDLFWHAEDDMMLTRQHLYPTLALGYMLWEMHFRVRHHSAQARRWWSQHKFIPGFFRVEKGETRDGKAYSWEVDQEYYSWETSPEHFRVWSLPEGSKPPPNAPVELQKIVYLRKANNQAAIVNTREQLMHLNKSCGYLWPMPKTDGWVEWWSGGVQQYSRPCGDMHKALLHDRFSSSILHHLANNKHGKRGKRPPTPLTKIVDAILKQ